MQRKCSPKCKTWSETLEGLEILYGIKIFYCISEVQWIKQCCKNIIPFHK